MIKHRRAQWWRSLLPSVFAAALTASAAEPGLLFHLSADQGTTADFSAAGTAAPTFANEVTTIADGAKGAALSCGNLQTLAWRAPGNIFAQRGTLSFFWRSRYPVGPTEFPVFRVGYSDHSSWEMVWLRIDYNGHGFDAFVTDASLSRTRVSVTLPEFPKPDAWIHLALAWDETRGIRFYVNGKLTAKQETVAVYDAGLDQFGPHSRIIGPWHVQSDYNFTRGGDIDEIRIYDRMVDDGAVATLAQGGAPVLKRAPFRSLADATTREEWGTRYGWGIRDVPPVLPPGPVATVRKVEIHDAYDLKRWWWKANDGIRETTWPGVYNRSRLPGRLDYFTLPDWDCYSLSGKSITFALPEEPVNRVVISGAAWGRMELLPKGTANETASEAKAEALLFTRSKGREKTIDPLSGDLAGRKIRFTNTEQEEPIGELSAYNVTAGKEPAGSEKIELFLTDQVDADELGLSPLQNFIRGRFPPDEQTMMVAFKPAFLGDRKATREAPPPPIVHVLIPNTWDDRTDALDGIAIDMPTFDPRKTDHDDMVALNIQVKDPLWPARNLLDFTYSIRTDEKKTLWLDLRDRMLPPGKALYLTVACTEPGFHEVKLFGASLRLVFKPREAARAEHELDRFTQARDSYAMLVEEHPANAKYDLWVRFESDLKDLLRVNPDHVLGRQYASMGMNAPRPAFTQPEPPAGVPLWAFRQVEALGRAGKFINWWIDHRQIPNGEFGGGLSDDTDLTNLWPGVALMGYEPEKLADSIRRELDACYAQGMFTNGLPTIQADELHSYEEGINALGQNLILDYGSPRQIERAMENMRGIESVTGINRAGHRHIRSSYYSGTKMAEEEPWGYAKAYNYLALQPGQLLVDYNGNPAAKKILLELSDGLRAHRQKDSNGRFSLPTAIHFADDRDSTATRRYFPWPLFWSSWQWTGQPEHLEPIFDAGLPALTAVNANALDRLNLRAEWGPRFLAAEQGGSVAQRNSDRVTGNSHFTWQLTGDKRILEKIYGAQIETMALGEYINTEGSLWSDRVGVPTSELQRARLGGVALARNALFPGHAVSWKFAAPATAQSVAILLPDATATAFKVIACNLSTAPVSAVMTGWNVDPGQWEITQGIDTNDDDTADQALETRAALFERTRSVELSFAPRATTVLTFKLKTPGTPYWARPDLGIDPQDVSVQGREVHVTVHSLGSVPSPEASVVLRDPAGRALVTGKLAALPAPDDLRPRTATVTLRVPAGVDPRDCTVEIDPSHQLEEITTRNNAVKLR